MIKGEPDETDLRILQILSEGATDEYVARTLGIGRRTVQRKVNAMMCALGVVGRLALGARAAQLGWLERPVQLLSEQAHTDFPEQAERAAPAAKRSAGEAEDDIVDAASLHSAVAATHSA